MMPKKSILKDLIDRSIDKETKQDIKNSYNDLKKQFNGLLNEMGVQKSKEERKPNQTTSKNSKNENIKITKLKENISTIIALELMLCMFCFSMAMANFFGDNVMLGVFLILLIPFMIVVTIMLCLKYAGLKFKDHLAFLIDKINRKVNPIIEKTKKVVTSENFIIITFVIISFAFFIFVFLAMPEVNQ